MSRVPPVYRTEDKVRDDAKLILGFDKFENGIMFLKKNREEKNNGKIN